MNGSTILALALTAITQSELSTAKLDWTWDRDAPGCALNQEIQGDGATLQVARMPGNDFTSVRIDGPRRSLSGSSATAVTVTLEPGGPTPADGYVGYYPGNRARRLITVAVKDRAFLDRLAHASAITLDGKTIGRRRAEIRHAAAAVHALRSCEEAKMRSWGIDPAAQRALRSGPAPLLESNGLTREDYPWDLAREGLGGKVVVRLTIGTDGTVKKCVSVLPKTAPAFAAAVCKAVTQRARFTPAQDPSGRPVEAPYVFGVNFQMPSW